MSESRAPAQRLEALTSLRIFAALLVVAHHYRPLGLGEAPHAILNILHNGTQAVTLFFILSGFVLGYNQFRSNPTTPVDTRSFWAARFARIYPLYVLALVLSLPFFLYSFFVAKRLSAELLCASLILVPALLQSWIPATALSWNPPAWSLSVEAFFYFLFPAVAKRLRQRSSLGGLLGILALAATAEFIRVRCYGSTEPESLARHFASYFPLLHLPKFVLGVALARFYLDTSSMVNSRQATALTWSTLAIATFLLSLHTQQLAELVSAALIVTFSALIYFASCIRNPGIGHLNSPLLTLFGEASYGVYILHLPIGMWFSFLMKQSGIGEWHNSILCSAAYVAVVMAASIISYRWIETPLRRALRRRLQA